MPAAKKALSPWLNPYVRPIFVKGQKKDDIFAKYSLTNFSLEKHATQNFYVFKLEKHPKVS